jgi:hypothetical protein
MVTNLRRFFTLLQENSQFNCDFRVRVCGEGQHKGNLKAEGRIEFVVDSSGFFRLRIFLCCFLALKEKKIQQKKKKKKKKKARKERKHRTPTPAHQHQRKKRQTSELTASSFFAFGPNLFFDYFFFRPFRSKKKKKKKGNDNTRAAASAAAPHRSAIAATTTDATATSARQPRARSEFRSAARADVGATGRDE